MAAYTFTALTLAIVNAVRYRKYGSPAYSAAKAISLASATLGLLVGTIIKPTQIAAMFPGFLMPVVFLGAIFFSWQSLSAIPVLQAIVLVNPLVYANEALRAVMTPQIAHMPLVWSVAGLVAAIVLMGGFGFRRFHRMVVGAQK